MACINALPCCLTMRFLMCWSLTRGTYQVADTVVCHRLFYAICQSTCSTSSWFSKMIFCMMFLSVTSLPIFKNIGTFF